MCGRKSKRARWWAAWCVLLLFCFSSAHVAEPEALPNAPSGYFWALVPEGAVYYLTEEQIQAFENRNAEDSQTISEQKADIETLKQQLSESEAERIASNAREDQWVTFSERLKRDNASLRRGRDIWRAVGIGASAVALVLGVLDLVRRSLPP